MFGAWAPIPVTSVQVEVQSVKQEMEDSNWIYSGGAQTVPSVEEYRGVIGRVF